VHVDLSRGEADPRRRVHGFRHVRDELLERLVEHSDGRCLLVQPGIGIAEDIELGHQIGLGAKTQFGATS
jgi:hypothetical protein